MKENIKISKKENKLIFKDQKSKKVSSDHNTLTLTPHWRAKPRQVYTANHKRSQNQKHHTRGTTHKLWDEEQVGDAGEDPAAGGQNISRGGGSHNPKHNASTCM